MTSTTDNINNKDSHHDDNTPDEEFHPKIKGGADSDELCVEKCAAAANCFRAFAHGYTGTWAWPARSGKNNCHSFQKQGMKQCGLTK
jgi:hypothetical protein